MGVAAAGAVASGAAAAAGPSRHGQMALAGAGESTHVGASPCAEIDVNDDSMPVPGEAPVSQRTAPLVYNPRKIPNSLVS